MNDLRRECAKRLRSTLHGREVDLFYEDVDVAQMLGVAEFGTISTRDAEQGTILDPDHSFWDEYTEEVQTRNAVYSHVKSAISSLREDNIFKITHPYGEAADVVYCEVERFGEPSGVGVRTTCKSCGQNTMATLNIVNRNGTYSLEGDISCEACGFDDSFYMMEDE